MQYRQIFKVALILLMSMLIISANAGEINTVLIIENRDNTTHQQLIKTIESSLQDSSISSKLISASEIESIKLDHYKLIITSGKKTTTQVTPLLSNKTVLSILPGINDINPFPYSTPANNNHAFMFMTHGICRQLKLASLVNEKWTNALLLSSNNNHDINKIDCTNNAKPKLTISHINDSTNIVKTLNESLKNSDVLIALPDSRIYNSKTIKSILLTTYRHRVPVIGFSKNMVKAGALTSLHSSIEQIGKDTADLIKQYFVNNKFIRKYNFPSIHTVVSNDMVARSLDIRPMDEETIKTQLIEKGNQ